VKVARWVLNGRWGERFPHRPLIPLPPYIIYIYNNLFPCDSFGAKVEDIHPKRGTSKGYGSHIALTESNLES
jgi:hypothetical protein